MSSGGAVKQAVPTKVALGAKKAAVLRAQAGVGGQHVLACEVPVTSSTR